MRDTEKQRNVNPWKSVVG